MRVIRNSKKTPWRSRLGGSQETIAARFDVALVQWIYRVADLVQMSSIVLSGGLSLKQLAPARRILSEG
jgi:hypothetical protein